MPDLQDLSMVLMTANRPRMFRAAIELYAQMAPGLTLLVADYGSRESQKLNAAVAAQFPAAVRYHPFAPQTPWSERFHRLLDACETPYVVPAADDDFLIPDGLAESVQFMRAHPDYAACHGIYYALIPSDPPGRLNVGISCGFTGRSYDSDTPAARLLALLFWYQSIYYAVQRRDDLRRVEIPAGVRSGAMTELFTAAAAVIAGKVARLRLPYALRNGIPADTSSRLSEFSEAIMLGGAEFLQEYLPVRNGLVELFRERAGDHDWGRLVDVAFATHVRKNWREEAMWSKLAERGDIPAEDVATLAAPGIESEVIPMPAEELTRYLGPLAARGWPTMG